MYQIYYESTCIYDDRVSDVDELKLISYSLTMEDNKAGSLKFKIPPSNVIYNTMANSDDRAVVTVRNDATNKYVWAGRITSVNTDFWNCKEVFCEGVLAWLDDCASPYYGNTQHGGYDVDEDISVAMNEVDDILDGYNSEYIYYYGIDDQPKVAEKYMIGRGRVTKRLPDKYRDSTGGTWYNADPQYTCLQKLNNSLNKWGGHFQARTASNGKHYLDWYNDLWGNGTSGSYIQTIRFGENLLDYAKEISTDEIFTVIHPFGDYLPSDAERYGFDDKVKVVPTTSYPFVNGWQINDSGQWVEITDASTRDKYFAPSVDVPIEVPDEKYYYSGRMKGDKVVYAVLDKNKVPLFIKKSGADASDKVVSINREEIPLASNARYIRCCWYKDDEYKYKDDDDNEHVYPREDYSELVRSADTTYSTARQRRCSIIDVTQNHRAYIQIPALVNKYGWIEKFVVFDGINQPNGLLVTAQTYINSLVFNTMSLEISFVDLALLSDSGVTTPLKIYDGVRVISEPHNLDTVMYVTKLTITNNPETSKITLGVNIRKTISELVRR